MNQTLFTSYISIGFIWIVLINISILTDWALGIVTVAVREEERKNIKNAWNVFKAYMNDDAQTQRAH